MGGCVTGGCHLSPRIVPGVPRIQPLAKRVCPTAAPDGPARSGWKRWAGRGGGGALGRRSGYFQPAGASGTRGVRHCPSHRLARTGCRQDTWRQLEASCEWHSIFSKVPAMLACSTHSQDCRACALSSSACQMSGMSGVGTHTGREAVPLMPGRSPPAAHKGRATRFCIQRALFLSPAHLP